MVFPLSEVGSTVGASSLPQGETADEPKGEQDNGQEDAQEGFDSFFIMCLGEGLF